MENNIYKLFSCTSLVFFIIFIFLIFSIFFILQKSCHDESKKLKDKKERWSDPEFGANAILKYD